MRSPPICSGSEVVGAAAMAPDGAKTSSFKASALRTTASRHGPVYRSRAAQPRQNATVVSIRRSTSSRPGKTSGSPYDALATSVDREPGRDSNRPVMPTASHSTGPASQVHTATAVPPLVATGKGTRGSMRVRSSP